MTKKMTPLLTTGIVILAWIFVTVIYLHSNASLPTSVLFTKNTDLILYSYLETPEAMQNLNFFMRHAIHTKADFIIMLNGDSTIDISPLRNLHNVRIVRRENKCFDLGGFHEILSDDPFLIKRYKRFMFTNASLRGPFIPPWADGVCWSDAYWDKLETHPSGTKAVGMTWNCANGTPYPPHIQSMILAFDRQTLTEILWPILKCYESMLSAVQDGELMITQSIHEAGGQIFAMEGRFGANAGPDGRNRSAFVEWCVDSPEDNESGTTHGNDILWSHNYEGTSIHPYETIFAKTNRGWDERDRAAIDLLTEHAEMSNYSSYDHCK